MLAGLAAVLTSSAAFASGQLAPDPRRPTVSIVGVRATSTGATSVQVGQRADYNAAAVVAVAPKVSVGVDQAGRSNMANVVVIGNKTDVGINQAANLRNAASVTSRPLPAILGGRR
jgi:hypothetical protein